MGRRRDGDGKEVKVGRGRSGEGLGRNGDWRE